MKNFLLPLLLIGCALSGTITTQAQSNYEPYSFTTLAGIAHITFTEKSTDGTGSAAHFYYPEGVAVDSAGNVYVADTDNYTIRKITPSGVVSTFAGLANGDGSADGAGCAARFFYPKGVAVDSAGTVYVADTGNDTIRKITPSGVVSTFAGLPGSSGSADGSGSAARFRSPNGVAVDSAGNVYVADTDNYTIRKITPSGVVSTLAGLAGSSGSADGTGSAARFNYPYGVAADSAGNVYVGDYVNSTIRKITPGGVVSTLAGLAGVPGSADGTGSAARFIFPEGVAVDSAGNVYVADSGNHTIRKITPSGVVSTLAGLAGSYGSDDGAGSAARFFSPSGVTVDSAGNVYVADSNNATIRKITPSGVVSTLAGLTTSNGNVNGTGSAARFDGPVGVTVDNAGNVYVADSGNHTIRGITPSGVVSTFAGLPGSSGSADGIGSEARFHFPSGVAVDSAGNVYVADSYNFTIRKITPSGVVSTLAGLAGSSGSSDGTGSAARFSYPNGVAVDSAGNVYVADAANNDTIRKISPSGVVSTLAGLAGSRGSVDGTGSAARFHTPLGVAVDSAGNVYVADAGDPDFFSGGNHTIRKISPSGVVSTLAGLAGSRGSADGTGSDARFNFPNGVAVDSAGNVYVADAGNRTIRKITPSGLVSTLAGLARSFGSADGAGSAARFSGPVGVTVDNAGNVYVGDYGNNTIRIGVKATPLITTVGQRFVYQVETAGATSFAVSNLPPGLSFDTQLSAIVGITTAAGTFQVGISVTYPTVTTNSTLTITVQPVPASGPVIASGTSTTGRAGRSFNFQVFTTGGTSAARLSANGLPPGLSVDAVTGIISGSAAGNGSSIVTLTVMDGSFTATATLQLTFTADPGLPVIISPGYATLTPNEFFSYTINVSGTGTCGSSGVPTTTFSFIGTLPAGLSFNAATGTISGIYTGPLRTGVNGGLSEPEQSGDIVLGGIQLFGTNSQGTGTLPFLFLPKPSGAVNIASRLLVGTGENVLIGGFIITGDSPKVVLVRAIGPSLTNFGVPNALQDPMLKLQDSAGNIVVNDNWQSDQEQVIQDTSLSPRNALESAIIRGLYPGNYTAIVEGKDGATGTALVEVYDLGTALLGNSGSAKLGNIATRGFSGNGDNVLIGGFIIQSVATRIVVRGIGPSLTAFGVSGALSDPTLEIKNASGTTLIGNDDWQQGQPAELQQAGLAPSDSHESALITTLQPGQFTAIVSGKGGATGVATVEVYALQ